MAEIVHLALRVPAPALHPVGKLHPVNRRVARRHPLGEDVLLDLPDLGRTQAVPEVINCHQQRDRAFRGALEAQDLAVALDEAVPLRIIQHPADRELRELELSGVPVDEIDERRPGSEIMQPQQVRHMVGQAQFGGEEAGVIRQVGRQQRRPVLGKARILRVGADAREVGRIKQESAPLFGADGLAGRALFFAGARRGAFMVGRKFRE